MNQMFRARRATENRISRPTGSNLLSLTPTVPRKLVTVGYIRGRPKGSAAIIEINLQRTIM